jgi:hypothetical protein
MQPEGDDDKTTEEVGEERLKAEIVGHPTRDDWHEQREPEQAREGVLHVRSEIVTFRFTRTSRSKRSPNAPKRVR